MSKASIYTANTGAQSVASGGTLSLGSIVHRFGNVRGVPIINLNGNGITINEDGYYNINVSIVASPTTAGTVTVSVLRNGVALPGAIATSSVTTAGNPANLSIISQSLESCGAGSVLTLVLAGNASTISNVAVRVDRA
jgi:hypothetical protein